MNLTKLPERYREDWRARFDEEISKAPTVGCRILDIGSGRTPAIALDRRTPDCRYVGLDLSLQELQLAGPGAYDETVVADICEFHRELEGMFDLIVSWQVLEHVRSLEAALDNCQRYLRSGGILVAQFSGRYSAFGIANRLLPHRVARLLLKHLLGRNPDTVFPACYDRCYFDAIVGVMQGKWASVSVLPWYLGASYFTFSRPIQKLYVAMEERIFRGRHSNLASHYFVVAVRAPGAENELAPHPA